MTRESGVRGLIYTYQDFNSTRIDELPSEPSALEFMRHVSRNRPFIVRGAAAEWPAVRNWDAEYLKRKLHGKEVQVAITPDGRADAPTQAGDDKLYFAKPLERMAPFENVIERVVNQGRGLQGNSEVWYAQTQNDNLRGEYADIFQDVAQDIAWARIALQKEPDAINMWIGSAESVTALHRDPYQNVYIQVIGAKRFVLVPPAEMACVNEHLLPTASWTARNDMNQTVVNEPPLRLVPEEGADAVPCALWDPDFPTQRPNSLSKLCRPLHMELHPGDILYLPALWYHKVSQIVGPEGFCCSVNYWYDMDFDGSFHAYDQFLRQETLQRG